MSRYFPNDCPIECPYYRRWDMSVDDYTNICVLLKMQIDDCDSDFLKHKCPLESKEEQNEGRSD